MAKRPLGNNAAAIVSDIELLADESATAMSVGLAHLFRGEKDEAGYIFASTIDAVQVVKLLAQYTQRGEYTSALSTLTEYRQRRRSFEAERSPRKLPPNRGRFIS